MSERAVSASQGVHTCDFSAQRLELRTAKERVSARKDQVAGLTAHASGRRHATRVSCTCSTRNWPRLQAQGAAKRSALKTERHAYLPLKAHLQGQRALPRPQTQAQAQAQPQARAQAERTPRQRAEAPWRSAAPLATSSHLWRLRSPRRVRASCASGGSTASADTRQHA